MTTMLYAYAKTQGQNISVLAACHHCACNKPFSAATHTFCCITIACTTYVSTWRQQSSTHDCIDEQRRICDKLLLLRCIVIMLQRAGCSMAQHALDAHPSACCPAVVQLHYSAQVLMEVQLLLAAQEAQGPLGLQLPDNLQPELDPRCSPA